jgi:hypothetical protein
MTPSIWRIGQLLNSVQSTFVGLLRIWSIPIVLMLSVASGYTTFYGMSYFITPWISLIVTVAVQSIVVIATLELAGIHWRANLPRYLMTLLSLLVALSVSVSFSYFKFYEFSQRDNVLVERHQHFEEDLARYIDAVARLKGEMVAKQRQRADDAAREANQAYLGIHPAMTGKDYVQSGKVGKGPFWSLYNEAQQREQAQLAKLEQSFVELDRHMTELRTRLKEFSFHMQDAAAYEKVVLSFGQLQAQAENLAAGVGVPPVKAPVLAPFVKITSGMTPTFDMWDNISWFALACAAMVDFFTVILSYRLEFTAPGPLTEEEKELAYLGLRQFANFTINSNDELEFQIERTELERARRTPDWTRMFAVAFLLNRGYLRKISEKKVEFAPNLYPVISARLQARADAAAAPAPGEQALQSLMEKKSHG